MGTTWVLFDKKHFNHSNKLPYTFCKIPVFSLIINSWLDIESNLFFESQRITRYDTIYVRSKADKMASLV